MVDDLSTAIRHADVILTDGPGEHAEQLAPYQITASLLDTAPPGAQFNPCPPIHRGREASMDALNHSAFVGHQFKAMLLPVHQAIMAFCAQG
jgi:ornithine carbamoyltransferase